MVLTEGSKMDKGKTDAINFWSPSIKPMLFVQWQIAHEVMMEEVCQVESLSEP